MNGELSRGRKDSIFAVHISHPAVLKMDIKRLLFIAAGKERGFFMFKNMTTRKLCLCAAMIALHIVLDMISLRIGNNIKITFGGLPFVIIAIMYGPVEGLVVGLLATFLSQLINYGITVTTPLWIIPGGIHGLTMGLLYNAFGHKQELKPLTISIALSTLAVTIFNTLALYIDGKIMGYAPIIWATLPFRIISSILVAVCYSAIIMLLLKAVNKVKAH